MGASLSCISPASPLPPASDHIQFLSCSTGAMPELPAPITAAEAMLEFPSQFLCAFSAAASSSTRGSRICAVPADQELITTELYLLLPMHRLNTRFSRDETEAFAAIQAAHIVIARHAAKSKASNKGSQSKVAPCPQLRAEQILQSRSFKGLEGASRCRLQEQAAMMTGGGADSRVICRSKSWMPRLETVNENAIA